MASTVFRRAARLAAILMVLVLPAALCGCWTPEKYMARVRIEPDGSYRYVMEGTAVHGPTLLALRAAEQQIKSGGAMKPEEAAKLKAAAEAGMNKDLEAAQKDSRVQSITPIGGGRVRFSASGRGSIAGGELVFSERFTPLSYAQAGAGALSVRVKDAVAGRDAERLGLSVEGDVSVSLGPGVEVLEHNAASAPGKPGGSYRWRVEKPGEPAPWLVLRLPSAAPEPAPPAKSEGPGKASPSQGQARPLAPKAKSGH